MPICQNCQNQWTWKQTIEKMFTLDSGMICPHCEQKQFLTNHSKQKSCFANFLTPLVILLAAMFAVTPIVTLILVGFTFCLLIAVYPVLITFANTEEHLW